MLEKGWNQSVLARRAKKFTKGKMGRSNISVYIRGKSLPSPTNLYAVARALDVTTEELLPDIIEEAEAISEGKPFEMSSVPGMPGKVNLRINEIVSFDRAIKIVQMLKQDVGSD